VLCGRPVEQGTLVKMTGGKASCVKPLAEAEAGGGKKDDDDDGMPDPQEVLKRMQRGEPMENWMKKK